MNAIQGIVKFQSDRDLHKRGYDWTVEAINIVEELTEALGVDDRNVAILSVGDITLRVDEKVKLGLVPVPSIADQVDAFADICVFAMGAIMKLGYDPELVLQEVSKEINSREGTMIDGKFTKDKSLEAKAKWYKANFTQCKLYITSINEKQRTAYFNGTGRYGSDEEIAEWLKSLLG